MVKQGSLIVTADTAKITQESTAAGHHLGKSNLLTKENECKDIGKCEEEDGAKKKKRLSHREYCPINDAHHLTRNFTFSIFNHYPSECGLWNTNTVQATNY